MIIMVRKRKLIAITLGNDTIKALGVLRKETGIPTSQALERAFWKQHKKAKKIF